MNHAKSFASFACVAGLISIAGMSFAQTKQPSPMEAIDTSVSQITAKSDSFVGKRVRIRARFESDGLESSVLVEPQCAFLDDPKQKRPSDPKCKLGIVPSDLAGVEDHADIKAFDRALEKGVSGTKDKRVVATFTGWFRCKPACSAIGGRILEIESIDDLDVTMIVAKGSAKPKGARGSPTRRCSVWGS
jgi:hypothetical protein